MSKTQRGKHCPQPQLKWIKTHTGPVKQIERVVMSHILQPFRGKAMTEVCRSGWKLPSVWTPCCFGPKVTNCFGSNEMQMSCLPAARKHLPAFQAREIETQSCCSYARFLAESCWNGLFSSHRCVWSLCEGRCLLPVASQLWRQTLGRACDTCWRRREENDEFSASWLKQGN